MVIVSAPTPLHPLGQSTTIYAVDSASSTTGGERSRWGWDSPRRYVLQGSQHFFFPPMVGAFVSLVMANAKSSVCVFTPSERGKVSRELLKIIKDKLIIIKIVKESIGGC